MIDRTATSSPDVRRQPEARSGLRAWHLALLLGLVAFAIYLPAVTNEFVNYDDPDYLTSNSHVQQGLTLENIKWAFTTGHASNWHPITWLSHMLDWQFFGARAGAHHVVSAAFHAVNSILVFLFLRLATKALWRSWLVAALFAVHPLHVESVAWASERKDVLSAFFGLLTWIAYTKYASPGTLERNEDQKGFAAARKWYWYFLALVALAFGLLAKPMLVTWPFVLLLLDFWPLHRIALQYHGAADREDNIRRQKGVGQKHIPGISMLLLEKLPFLVLSIASSIITYKVQRQGGAVSFSLTIYERFANAVVSYGRYLIKGFWPTKLSVLYPHPGRWPALWVILSLLAIMAITVRAVITWRQRSYLLTGWLLFLGTMVPTIGLVQVGVQSMADRYTYVPYLGIFIMVIWGLHELFQRFGTPTWLAATCAAVALVLCTGFTERQIWFWHDSERLFRHAVTVTEGNFLAWNNLGFFLQNSGKTAEAMECYKKSIEINSGYEEAQNNIGYALAAQKKYKEAISHYMIALAIRPNHPEVHNNLGNALADTGQLDAAIEHYQVTLKAIPEHADAHNNYGIALAMKGRIDEAIPHFQAAIRNKENYASAHSNLGNALALQGKWPDAIREYETCLAINPKDSQGHNNLANALVETGNIEEARKHYEQSLLLNPDSAEGHYNLALVLLRQNQTAEAKQHLTKALQLKPDYADARAQLNALRVLPAK